MIRFEGSGKYGIGVWRDTELLAMIHADDWNTFRLSSVLIFLTADELEQIAAKLRELNGEPNTRALDERVKELREFAREIIELAYEGDVDSGQIYEIGTRTGVMRVEDKTVPCVPCDETSEFCCACAEHADHGEVVDCYRLNPELFPAELKEKP